MEVFVPCLYCTVAVSVGDIPGDHAMVSDALLEILASVVTVWGSEIGWFVGFVVRFRGAVSGMDFRGVC